MQDIVERTVPTLGDKLQFLRGGEKLCLSAVSYKMWFYLIIFSTFSITSVTKTIIIAMPPFPGFLILISNT